MVLSGIRLRISRLSPRPSTLPGQWVASAGAPHDMPPVPSAAAHPQRHRASPGSPCVSAAVSSKLPAKEPAPPSPPRLTRRSIAVLCLHLWLRFPRAAMRLLRPAAELLRTLAGRHSGRSASCTTSLSPPRSAARTGSAAQNSVLRSTRRCSRFVDRADSASPHRSAEYRVAAPLLASVPADRQYPSRQAPLPATSGCPVQIHVQTA